MEISRWLTPPANFRSASDAFSRANAAVFLPDSLASAVLTGRHAAYLRTAAEPMPPRVAAWNVAAMKAKLPLACLTRLSLLGALVCSTPMLTLAGERRETHGRMERFAPEPRREPITRLETRNQFGSERNSISKDYVRQRLDWLKEKDPRHFKTHAYFETLIDAGYDPLLLDTWLDGLYDGVIVVGMPGDLVLDYYGQPVSSKAVVFNSVPATEWGVQFRPGRVERVTVAHGKVVRVRA